VKPRKFPSRPPRERRPAVARNPSRKRTPDRPAPKAIVSRQGPLHAEIVVVGRELLRGLVEDDNGRWVAGQLTRHGALVHRVTVVDDLERSIASAISEALARGAQLVVTTGGLGPALDDRTLTGVSGALSLPLAMSPPARDMVEDGYRRLKDAGVVSQTGLTAAREKMCLLPVGSEALPNSRGIAPGVLVRLTGGGAVICTPGRPGETKTVLDEGLARLKDLLPLRASAAREIEAPTSDEAALRPVLDLVTGEYPGVWIQSHPASGKKKDPVRVTLQSFAATQKEADALVDGALRRLVSLSANR
jgi:molybdopterin-biosynthesis enzyme MoeA-like protein